MHDRQNLFDKKTSNAGEWAVDGTLDGVKAQIIVVGIEHGNEKRLCELTPFIHPKHGRWKGKFIFRFYGKLFKNKCLHQL